MNVARRYLNGQAVNESDLLIACKRFVARVFRSLKTKQRRIKFKSLGKRGWR